jgi:hypothetical protein
MRSAATVFLAAFIAVSASWAGFVLAPQLQLGRGAQGTNLVSQALYPLARQGLAAQGAEVYRSLGCVYCHSQQVGQEGVRVEVLLTDAGTNALATLAALAQLDAVLGKPETLASLPRVIRQVQNVAAADPVVKAIAGAGAKAEVNIVPVGTDIARGWGKRRSVAADYVYDATVQLGTRRAGPDLANTGIARGELALAASLRAAIRGEGFDDAAVSVFVRGTSRRQEQSRRRACVSSGRRARRN